VKLTDDVKQRKQKHFKQYRTAKQKPTNKENLVRFLHRGKPSSCVFFSPPTKPVPFDNNSL